MGLNRDQLVAMERAICAAIAKEVNVPDNKIPMHTPHSDFAAWVKKVNRTVPLELFTTNYDVLIEKALEGCRVPVFDGFVGTHQPFFYPECLDDETLLPTPRWIRLWKLHGSVNWHCEKGRAGTTIVRSQPSETGELILPSHRKYDESRKQPYIAYMDRLSRVLNSDYSLLLTCGYSFSDDHINSILYGALDNRNTANIIALQFGELKESDEVVEAALRRPNLTVIGRNGGVLSGIWGLWRLAKPVDDTTHSFMDIAFDSNAMPEDSGSPAASPDNLNGKMRLGDFNRFGRFLNAMGPGVR